MFLSGALPMSSEVTTSVNESAARLVSSDFSIEARIPVTVMVSRVAGFCCCACAGSAAPHRARATAEAIGVGFIFMLSSP
jgi:hypothetical protein